MERKRAEGGGEEETNTDDEERNKEDAGGGGKVHFIFYVILTYLMFSNHYSLRLCLVFKDCLHPQGLSAPQPSRYRWYVLPKLWYPPTETITYCHEQEDNNMNIHLCENFTSFSEHVIHICMP
jgi:hypothetical protein